MTELHYNANAPVFPEESPRYWTKAQQQTAREAADAMGLWAFTSTQVALMDEESRNHYAKLVFLMHEHEVTGWMDPESVQEALRKAPTDPDALKSLVQIGFERLNNPTIDDAAHMVTLFNSTRSPEEARLGMIQVLALCGDTLFEDFSKRLITRMQMVPNSETLEESLADKLEARRAPNSQASTPTGPAVQLPKIS